MSSQGIAQIVFYVVVLTVLGYPLGIYMSRIYEAERAPGGRFLGAIERRFLRLVGVHDEEGSEQTWTAYAKTVMIFSVVFFAGLYVLLRIQGHLFLNPDKDERRPIAACAEYRRELHHQHELAVLRRRGDHVVPLANGRPGGTELRLRRGGHGRPRGGDPRLCPPQLAQHRQLLA